MSCGLAAKTHETVIMLTEARNKKKVACNIREERGVLYSCIGREGDTHLDEENALLKVVLGEFVTVLAVLGTTEASSPLKQSS